MNNKESHMPEAYDYLHRVMTERLNANSLQKAHRGLSSHIELLRYELAETLAEARDARQHYLQDLETVRARLADAEQARMKAEKNASEAHDARQHYLRDLEAAQARIGFLEETLTNALRRPLKPLGQALRRRLAYISAGVVGLLSKRYRAKLKASARKRDPRRYLNGGGGPTSVKHLEAQYTSDDHIYDCQTREISERFLPFAKDERPFHLDLCSADFVRARLEAAPVGNLALPDSEIGFSVLTPYFAHESFFVECAKSVAAAAVRVNRPVEWVVFNDDPTMPDDQLKSLIPEALQRQVRIVSDGQNHGIAVAQNRAAAAASYTWLVLLDCDDLLEPQALEALETAIIGAPGTRYFSSLMIDIDESGAELRRRRREHMPSDLFREGMIVGHMVAVRRDLFDALQGFDPRFSGVQDYHFALRVAQREQIGCLPMHLYRYRWHERTQSISGAFRQAKLSNAVRSAFLNESLGVERPGPLTTTDLPLIPRALCVVRTQGGRMELLENTLASIRAQSLQITPCIVVHGDDDLHDFVKRQLTKQSLPDETVPAVILKAPNTSLKRGYPCNVALDYLEKNRDTYDLLCFLDDDDHYLPGFADRLVHLMRATEADIAYCATNALPKTGEPVAQHKLLPFTALLAGNFIPFNSFLVRTEAVFAARARFNETLHYLEDYDFLVQLLLAGVRAEPLHETLSEYRLLGDGNSAIKQDVAHFQECEEQVRQRIAGAALSKPASATIRSSALTEEAFIADVMAFPFKAGTGQWGDQEFTHLKIAYDVLKQLRRKE